MDRLTPVQEAIIASISRPAKRKRGRPSKPTAEHKRILHICIDPDLYERLDEIRAKRFVGGKEKDKDETVGKPFHQYLSPMINAILRQWAFADERTEAERLGQQYRAFVAKTLVLADRARLRLNEQVFDKMPDYAYKTMVEFGDLSRLTPENHEPVHTLETSEVEEMRDMMLKEIRRILVTDLSLMQRKAVAADLIRVSNLFCDVLNMVQAQHAEMHDELAKLVAAADSGEWHSSQDCEAGGRNDGPCELCAVLSNARAVLAAVDID